jgi:hypothetical protein
LFFHGDGLLAVKWRNSKIYSIVHVTAQGAVRQAGQGQLTAYKQQLVYPWIFNVEADPKELWNISGSSTWVGDGAIKYVKDYMRSLKDFPNIKAGEDR